MKTTPNRIQCGAIAASSGEITAFNKRFLPGYIVEIEELNPDACRLPVNDRPENTIFSKLASIFVPVSHRNRINNCRFPENLEEFDYNVFFETYKLPVPKSLARISAFHCDFVEFATVSLGKIDYVMDLLPPWIQRNKSIRHWNSATTVVDSKVLYGKVVKKLDELRATVSLKNTESGEAEDHVTTLNSLRNKDLDIGDEFYCIIEKLSSGDTTMRFTKSIQSDKKLSNNEIQLLKDAQTQLLEALEKSS